ncbi:N-acetyltransferase family protein [Glacieibacterium sp.]|uniref:GNAT family N-acetyltransferase n=1 Tax=Glacieibacterium sp. TaxID=2860237 RepID=UPI003AFF6D26
MRSNADLSIRDATGDDMSSVTAIYARHVLTGMATFEVDPPGEAEMHSRWFKMVGAGWPYLVAVRGGEVIGYAYAAQFRDRAAYRHTGEMSIYLSLDHVRQGIGRLLLEALIERARDAGFRQLIGVISDGEASGSIALHRACGFETVGLLRNVGEKFGRLIDVVFMQRAI